MTKTPKTVSKTVKPPKAGRLATEVQPSPEAKKAGWERRRQRESIMNTLTQYMSMNRKEFFDLMEDIKKNPANYTMQESILAQYVTKTNNKDNFLMDWIDRNVEKAPTKTEITGEDGTQFQIVIKKYNADDKDTDAK
jgi:hypothetical protein